MKFNYKIVFSVACLGMLLFGIVFLSLGTVLTFIKENYSLNDLTAGSLTAVLPFGVLIGSLFFGPIVDRYGYRTILFISTFIIFIAFEGIAFAGSFEFLQIAFLIIGFAGGVINGATNALVSDISTVGKGSKLSLLGVFYGIGAVGMPLLIGGLSKSISYRSIVAGVGIFVLLSSLVFLIIKFPAPKQSHKISIKAISKLFSPLLLLFGLVLFFESAMEGISNNWTTIFASHKFRLSINSILMSLTLLNVSLLISRLILGFLLKKIENSKVLYFGLAFIFLGGVILNFSSNIYQLYAGVMLIGLGFGPGFPVILGYVGEVYPTLTGTAFSIVITMALIGNTMVNGLVALVSQSYGIQKLPFVLIGCVILMAIIFSISINKVNKINHAKIRLGDSVAR